MIVRAVVNGRDSWYDTLSPWGAPLESRWAANITQAGYQVLNMSITPQEGVTGFDFQARVTLDSLVMSGKADEVRSMLHWTLTSATGFQPYAVAIEGSVLSPGDPTPDAPRTIGGGLLDAFQELVGGVGDLASGARQLTNVAPILIIAVGVAAVVLAFKIANKGKLPI